MELQTYGIKIGMNAYRMYMVFIDFIEGGCIEAFEKLGLARGRGVVVLFALDRNADFVRSNCLDLLALP